jgi:GAF domain-containing protein
VPIVVEGRVWGFAFASSTADQPFAEDAEARIAAFTELVAMAISNAQARAEARRLGDEQAALRRVATLVARERPPAEIFAAVGEEVGRVLPVEDTAVLRYEHDGTATIVATWAGSRECVRGRAHPWTATTSQHWSHAPAGLRASTTTRRQAALSERACGSSASVRRSGVRSRWRDGCGAR